MLASTSLQIPDSTRFIRIDGPGQRGWFRQQQNRWTSRGTGTLVFGHLATRPMVSYTDGKTLK